MCFHYYYYFVFFHLLYFFKDDSWAKERFHESMASSFVFTRYTRWWGQGCGIFAMSRGEPRWSYFSVWYANMLAIGAPAASLSDRIGVNKKEKKTIANFTRKNTGQTTRPIERRWEKNHNIHLNEYDRVRKHARVRWSWSRWRLKSSTRFGEEVVKFLV